MTIAACHVSPEGVVLGADSTTTITRTLPSGETRDWSFDYAQKVFEVGESPSTVGLVTWGQGLIGSCSHRTLAARLAKKHSLVPFDSIEKMTQSLSDDLWTCYSSEYAAEIQRAHDLLAKGVAGTIQKDELKEYNKLLAELSGGYCLAGRIESPGECEARVILWEPQTDKPSIDLVSREAPVFWGVPHIMQRLIFGLDEGVVTQILQHPKWTGTLKELFDIIAANQLIQPSHLPIREAIDWIHTVIHTTIRGVKFAPWPHLCGGPIEIATVTTDRPFRWVCHKEMNAAIVTAQESTW